MQETNKKILFYQRVNRSQAVFFPNILYTTQQKESFFKQTPKKIRCQSELNILNQKCQLNDCGRDFKHDQLFQDPFMTNRYKDQQRFQKLKRNLSIQEKRNQVELIGNTIKQNMRKRDDRASLFSKSQSLILKIGNLNQNQDENSNLQESIFNDDNFKNQHFQAPQQIQNLKLNEESKERLEGLITPKSKNMEINENKSQAQRQLRIRGVQTFYQSEEKKNQSFHNEDFSKKLLETIKNLRQEKAPCIRNKKLNKERRSLSSYFNEKISNNISLQSQCKINKIKQFTIKAINDKNQHMFSDSNQFLGYKIHQSPTNLNNNQTNQIQKPQQESQVVQFKVNKYLQNLKVQQLKQSKQFCSINFASFYPLKMNENQEKISQSIQQYLKQDYQIRKSEKQQKMYINQLKENNKDHIDIDQTTKSDFKSPKSGNFPSHKQQNTPLKNLDKKLIDQIPLLPFSQATNNISIQNNIDQEYNDDLDLYQYVEKNVKILS